MADSASAGSLAGGEEEEGILSSMCSVYFPVSEFSTRYGEQFFTVSMEGGVIFDASPQMGSKHVRYALRIMYGQKSHVVHHRYSEFLALHHKLVPLGLQSKVVRVPPKTCSRLFKDPFDPNFIERRAEGLYTYLHSVMQDRTAIDSALVRDFLDLP